MVTREDTQPATFAQRLELATEMGRMLAEKAGPPLTHEDLIAVALLWRADDSWQDVRHLALGMWGWGRTEGASSDG